MFDFKSWAGSYLQPVFGSHSEMSFTGPCQVAVAWTVAYESGANRRFEVILRLDDALYDHLKAADADERATRGLAINAWLLREGIAPGLIPQTSGKTIVIGKGVAGL